MTREYSRAEIKALEHTLPENGNVILEFFVYYSLYVNTIF